MFNKKHKNAVKVEIPEYQTIREIVLEGTKRGGDNKQFMFLDRNKQLQEINYNQTFYRIRTLSTYFYSKGLRDGKKIAIVSENIIDWSFAYYAIIVGGNVCVPMDAKLSYEDIEDQIIRCDCDALVHSAKFNKAVEEFKANPDMPEMQYFCLEDYNSFLNEGQAALDAGNNDFINAEVKPDDLACIAYTSGTTAKSKGVMLTHYNIASNCTASTRALNGRHAIGFLPLNHTYAWVSALFASYILTQWGYLCDGIKNIQGDMKKYQPYNICGVPLVVNTIYNRIWKTARKTGREDILKKGLKISNTLMKLGIDRRRKIFKTIIDNLGGNLNMIVCGGANLDPKYEQGMHDFGIEIYNGYGLTECSPAVTCNRPDKYRFGSVGTPLDCCEIKIENPDEYGVGEIYVKGQNVMKGYYNEPEATAEVFEGEWFKTGDYGRIDEDGFLFMVGRKKNLICLSNGKNVSPEELEDKLSRIEYVKEVLVYEEDGKIVAEFFFDIEEYPDAKARIKNDVDEFNRNMPIFKNIHKYKVRDEEFPKTTTLKIARNNR